MNNKAIFQTRKVNNFRKKEFIQLNKYIIILVGFICNNALYIQITEKISVSVSVYDYLVIYRPVFAFHWVIRKPSHHPFIHFYFRWFFTKLWWFHISPFHFPWHDRSCSSPMCSILLRLMHTFYFLQLSDSLLKSTPWIQTSDSIVNDCSFLRMVNMDLATHLLSAWDMTLYVLPTA